jgi:hypothetical protein
VASHQIDLKDHLAASLNSLRFPERVWESDFMAKSGFYTNRLRRPAILRMFEEARFRADVQGVKQWPSIPLPRRKLAPAFRDLADDELRVSQFDVVAWPV